MSFPTAYEQILQKVDQVDPVAYGKTRNFLDGAVSRLSPYISRGVISTKMVMESILGQGHPFYKVEKFIQELAWRDYWQQVWLAKGDAINEDLKRTQENVNHHGIPAALVEATTGITVIDEAIRDYYEHGYLHNHVRMYIASIACNVGRSHWKTPARWMYYHLIDGDWASNALSWQWVAGANANKKYFANQENINKYCYTDQRNTFLDVPYERFDQMEVPKVLEGAIIPDFVTPLPSVEEFQLDTHLPTLIYNYYNLDPRWRADQKANRILLLEPSVFQQYPVSQNVIHFLLELAKNIEGIQVFVGEFEDLKTKTDHSEIFYKEHPFNSNYQGNQDQRNWMFPVTGYFPSFFAFWKKCKKELKS